MSEVEEIREDLESIKSFADVLHYQPKVHCIVNDVALALTANALLAVGAQPSMTNDPFEINAFTESADALSINLGMLNNDKRNAIRIATKCATKHKIPWVLDITLIERSILRLDLCEELLVHQPAVIRGNHEEVLTLCNRLDKTKTELCKTHNTILVTTGEVDWVDSMRKSCELKKLGHQWMSQVSGLGCALSALIAAMLSTSDDAFSAALKTLFLFGVNGERAAKDAQGPGSFASIFLDHLSG